MESLGNSHSNLVTAEQENESDSGAATPAKEVRSPT